jgi:2-succinyl-6-hydroxy-2,4-cyclohexadiene-1-carboxylate synthase
MHGAVARPSIKKSCSQQASLQNPAMLLALDGFTENDQTWREVLGKREDLITPLLPGHGWKPCPNTVKIEDLADELVQHLGDGGDIIGYSMGGRLALLAALRHPEKVRRLVLISSGPGFKDDQLQGSRRTHEMALAETLEEEGLGPFVAMWEKNPILKPYRPFPRAIEENLRYARMQHEAKDLAGALRQLGAGAMPNLWDRLGELRSETLLVAGAADERYVGVMQEMKSLIPKARLEIIPEAGHAIHREKAGDLLQVVYSFLGA